MKFTPPIRKIQGWEYRTESHEEEHRLDRSLNEQTLEGWELVKVMSARESTGIIYRNVLMRRRVIWTVDKYGNKEAEQVHVLCDEFGTRVVD